MKFKKKKKNQVHIILHACPWSVKYILVRKYILNHKMGGKKYWWRGEERGIRKHTHTHLNTTSDGETNGTEQSSPNIWAQTWGRQFGPIPKIIWFHIHTFSGLIKPELKSRVWGTFSFHTKQLNHKPEFLLRGRLEFWPGSSSSRVTWHWYWKMTPKWKKIKIPGDRMNFTQTFLQNSKIKTEFWWMCHPNSHHCFRAGHKSKILILLLHQKCLKIRTWTKAAWQSWTGASQRVIVLLWLTNVCK